MSGYYALIYDDEGPIQTGVGRYGTFKEAVEEAAQWAEAEDYPVQAERLRATLNEL